MALTQEDKRFVIKRNSTSGVVPTIPGSGVTNVYDFTEGGWLDTDILVGEFFQNTADSKLWLRDDNGIHLIYHSGQTLDFIDLGDVPTGYTTFGGYSLVVNGSEDGIEFQEIVPVNNFTDLADTPSSYTGRTGYVPTVNPTEDGLEWQLPNSSLSGLTDFPGYVSGSSGDYLVLNQDGNGLEWLTPPTPTGTTANLSEVLDNGNTSGGYNIEMTSGDKIKGSKQLLFEVSGNTIQMPNKAGTVALTSDIEASNELSEVLANGNETGGNDIVMSDGDALVFGNGDEKINAGGKLIINAPNDAIEFYSGDEFIFSGAGYNVYSTLYAYNPTGTKSIAASPDSITPVLSFSSGSVQTTLSMLDDAVGVSQIKLPNSDGTLALQTDLSDYLNITGGTMTGGIEMGTNGISFNGGDSYVKWDDNIADYTTFVNDGDGFLFGTTTSVGGGYGIEFQQASLRLYTQTGNANLIWENNAWVGINPQMSLRPKNQTSSNVVEIPDASGDIILLTSTPTSATDTGVAGQFAYDSNYMYVCVATNTWKRTALSTW